MLRWLLVVANVAALSCAQGTVAPNNVLTVIPPDRTLQAKAGSTLEAKLMLELRTGYHVNSNTPSEDYLIPLRLTWAPGSLTAGEVAFPTPRMESYSFSKVPLSVFTGDFAITTKFAVPAGTPAGPATLTGKLRYQACNTKMCLPPKTIDVKLAAEIVK
jgi:hypothetical protein